MELISSLFVLVIMLIGLGMIVSGPAGANWVFRTLVRNPGQALARLTGRGVRWFVRRYPRWTIIIVLLLLLIAYLAF